MSLSDFRRIPWQACSKSSWPEVQVKFAFDIVLGKMLQPAPSRSNDISVPYLKAQNVQWGRVISKNLPEMWASEGEIKQLGLKINDLLVCEGGEVGRSAIVTEGLPKDCIFQNALHRVRPSNIGNTRYLYYCLILASETGWFDVICNRATIAHFTVEKFRELKILLPSMVDQKKIANYLDRETAHIDALITEKERMLALLEEKRTALISQAVTRGLNPDAPLKPSGLDWLGDIPAHWEIAQLRFVCHSLQTGPFGSQLHAKEYVDNGIPVINPAHLKENQIKPDMGITVSEDVALRLSVHRLKVGDIVFARRGELGRCAVVNDIETGWICGTGCLRLRCNLDVIEPNYVAMLFRATAAAKSLTLMSVGSTMDNLNTEILGHFRIPLPKLQEQQHIIKNLQRKTAGIDSLAQLLKETVELLKERRSALITAAVTGQIPPEEMAA